MMLNARELEAGVMLGNDVMTTRNRALMPDYLRLVALFGIVVVNVQFIAKTSA